MKKAMCVFILAAYVAFSAGFVSAQPQPLGFSLSPTNPTTSDNITAKVTIGCGFNVYKGNPYRVTMIQNNITVRLGEYRTDILVGVCPPTPDDEIDLGRLPAGSYTLTVISAAFGTQSSVTLVDNAPFTVTTARLRTQSPTIRLVYDGSWWNPADSGSGLFIWQDPLYRTFAAWFTYSAEGKPQWYVFQPTWPTSTATGTVDLLQTTRMPSSSFPPPNPTTNNVVGTASLDFTNFSAVDKGVLTITLTGGTKQVINIRRLTR